MLPPLPGGPAAGTPRRGMEPPPECRQETPALTEAAAEFLRLIGGCPPPPAPGLPFIPQAVPGGGSSVQREGTPAPAGGGRGLGA